MDIVIVGGGTAGWIAAYSIIKSQKGKHKVTLIESSQIGIIGAGEGSTGQMLNLLNGAFFKTKDRVNISDFMQKTDAVNKMAIKYENWSGNGSSYVAPVETSVGDKKENDYIYKYVISKFGNNNIHLSSRDGIYYDAQKYDEILAFHFDAHKVGEYFKNLCGNEVKTIDGTISDVIVSSNGNVENVMLDSGQLIEGDFFFDCSGFNRVLMKKLNVGWKSCKEYLSVNTAMPFLIQYKDNEKIIPETKATSLSAGWVWNIPLTTRRGCGYVFDSNFITKDQAKEEVEKYLGHEINPIKFINFDSGYSNKFWENNVICLGLSSSFFEPLQATSIHNTIFQLLLFIDYFMFDTIESTINPHSIYSYNRYVESVMTSSLNLISLNYQGKRRDSDFWRYITDNEITTDKIKSLKEIQKTRFLVESDIDQPDGGHGFGLIKYNMAGLNLVSREMAYNDLVNNNMYDFAEKEWQKYYKAFSYKKT
jgi:tryptophan halogenase